MVRLTYVRGLRTFCEFDREERRREITNVNRMDYTCFAGAMGSVVCIGLTLMITVFVPYSETLDNILAASIAFNGTNILASFGVVMYNDSFRERIAKVGLYRSNKKEISNL